jgi:NADH-quinone oxidoreductase subunit J
MTPLQIVFLLVAAATLISALMVVSVRRMMHAALWLILTLFGVAVLFATLENGFFTVIQVIVYIGAIAILIIFAVMLTRPNEQSRGLQINRMTVISGLASLCVAGGLIFTLSGWQAFASARPPLAAENVDNVVALGQALVSPDAYALPFEVASILLVGALVGAIYVANEQRKKEGA